MRVSDDEGVLKCKGCGEPTPWAERLNKHWDTGYCAACWASCPWCNDIMGGKPERQDAKGKRIHLRCANAREVAAVMSYDLVRGA